MFVLFHIEPILERGRARINANLIAYVYNYLFHPRLWRSFFFE